MRRPNKTLQKKNIKYGVDLGRVLRRYFDNPPVIPSGRKIGFVWTPKLFGAAVGVSDSAVRQWLRGDVLPSLNMATIISALFGQDPSDYNVQIAELWALLRSCEDARDGVDGDKFESRANPVDRRAPTLSERSTAFDTLPVSTSLSDDVCSALGGVQRVADAQAEHSELARVFINGDIKLQNLQCDQAVVASATHADEDNSKYNKSEISDKNSTQSLHFDIEKFDPSEKNLHIINGISNLDEDAVRKALRIHEIGNISQSDKDYTGARIAYEQALRIFRQIECVLGEACCNSNIGGVALSCSDHDRAKRAYKQALALFRQIGAVKGEAHCMMKLGDIAGHRSDRPSAKKAYEKALELYRNIGDLSGQGDCIASIANILLIDIDYASAQLLYERAISAYRQAGNLFGEAYCIYHLGEIARAQFDDVGAKLAYDQALPVFRQVGYVLGEANCVYYSGKIARRRSDHLHATAAFNEALLLYRQAGNVTGEIICLWKLANYRIMFVVMVRVLQSIPARIWRFLKTANSA